MQKINIGDYVSYINSSKSWDINNVSTTHIENKNYGVVKSFVGDNANLIDFFTGKYLEQVQITALTVSNKPKVKKYNNFNK